MCKMWLLLQLPLEEREAGEISIRTASNVKAYIFRKIFTACDNRTTTPPTDDNRTTRTARAKDY
jgi:hypothetical protein